MPNNWRGWLMAAAAMLPGTALAQEEGRREMQQTVGADAPPPRADRGNWGGARGGGQRPAGEAPRGGGERFGGARPNWQRAAPTAQPQVQPQLAPQPQATWRNERGGQRPNWTGDRAGVRPDANRAGWQGRDGTDGRPAWQGSNGNRTDGRPAWQGGDRNRADGRPAWQGGNGNRAENRPAWQGNGDRGPGGARRDDDRRDDGRRFGYDRRPSTGWQRDRADWIDNGRDDRRFENRAAWNRGWRSNDRYDWGRYRSANRGAYHLPRYYAPYGWGAGYRRFSVGVTLSSILFAQNYWIDDPYDYRLPPAYGPYRWVRYYNDALLVDIRYGQVVDVVYDIFW